MTDTIELADTIERPAAAAAENPLMAPEYGVLRDAGFPLSPEHLPKSSLNGDTVVFNVTTTDSTNTPDYAQAIQRLESQGCRITRDFESNPHFTLVRIEAPAALFPPAAIQGISDDIAAAAARAQKAWDKMDLNSLYYDANNPAAGC